MTKIGLGEGAFESVLDTSWTRERYSNSCSLEATKFKVPQSGMKRARHWGISSWSNHVDKGLLIMIFSDQENGLEVNISKPLLFLAHVSHMNHGCS